MNIFRLFSKEPVLRRITVVRATSMRLGEWQSDPGLVKQAKEIIEAPVFQVMLAILRNECPANYGLPIGATLDDRIAHACKSEGYSLALNNLEAMAEVQHEQAFIESTFEPEIRPAQNPTPEQPTT